MHGRSCCVARPLARAPLTVVIDEELLLDPADHGAGVREKGADLFSAVSDVQLEEEFFQRLEKRVERGQPFFGIFLPFSFTSSFRGRRMVRIPFL